jgi:hypothetical protein
MLDLITDRTLADVKNEMPKGLYGSIDLNRVESATNELAALLTVAGYPVVITVKTNWIDFEIRWDTEMTRYLNNIKKCVDQFCTLPPALPESMDYLTHIGANNIEKTLLNIERLIGMLKADYRYAGAFYAGDIDSLRNYEG